MKSSPRIGLAFSLGLLTALAGVSSPARAELPIAQIPLYLATSVDPAFIMAVDDSGSMQWEILAANQDGELIWGRDATSGAGDVYGFFENDGTLRDGGSNLTADFLELFPYAGRGTKRNAVPPLTNLGFARSPEFNPAYYDPNEIYLPWKRADGSLWESMDTTAEWQNVPVDPRQATPRRFNLTAVNENTTEGGDVNNARMFEFRTGMTIPAGTRFYEYGSAQNNGNVNDAECNNVPGTRRNSWRSETNSITMSQNCTLGISYYPATYFLTTNTSPDANTAGGNTANRFTYSNSDAATQGGPRPGTQPGNGVLYRYEIKSANYPSTAAYNAAMTNFANWFVYYRTRNLAMVAALTHSLSEITSMSVGYFQINGYNSTLGNYPNVVMRDLDVASQKAVLYADMTALDANGSTPNRWAVDNLGRQFMRTDSLAPIVNGCQVNAGMLFTDGYSNQGGPSSVSPNDSGMTLPFRDNHGDTMADLAAKYYLSNLRTGAAWENQFQVATACNGANPDPRLDCRDDPHMNFYGITLGALGREYGNGLYVDDPTTSLDEATEAAFGTPPTWRTRSDDSREAVDEIWHATMNSRGKFINATSPSRITQAMNEVLTSVIDSAQPSGGTAASGTRREAGFLVYVPIYDPGDWTGDVAAYELAPGGALGDLVWSAAAKLPAFGSRNLFVSMPSAGGYQLRTFTKSNLGANDAAAAATLGFGTGPNQTPLPATATIDQAINYLRGDNSRMLPGAGRVFRERTTRIGDILNSQPAVLDRGSRGYVSLPAADGGGVSGSGTYGEFVTTTKQTRTPVVFVGTNGGMLHAFNGGTDPVQGGKELFAVIPNSVLSNMNQLVQPNYRHRYYVDASPEIGDARLGGAWKSVMLTGNGGGGRSILALDVTDPTSGFSASNFLWEFTDRDLGLTYGRPQVVLLEDGKWYAAFGNGYNSVGDPAESIATRGHDAYLFLVQLDNPANFRKIRASTGTDVDQVNYTTQNGLGSVTAIDTDFDLKSDVIYAPDFKGNVWKFDLSSASPTSWGVAYGGAPLYTARTASGSLQNITGAIDVTLHHLSGYMVYFGTGRYFLIGDSAVPTPAPVDTFYAVWDNETTVVTGRAQLVQQSILTQANVVGVGDVRTTSENPIDWTTKRGWYMELKVGAADGGGERFIGQPVVAFGRVVFTTFVPLGSTCEPGGRNWLFALSAIGGAPDVSLPGCTNCGGLSLTPAGGSQAPALSPPLITDPTQPATPPCDPSDPNCVPPPCDPLDPACVPDCVPGVDAGCNLPADPSASIPGRVCLVNLSVVMPTGSIPFSQVSCGRQSWRQLQ